VVDTEGLARSYISHDYIRAVALVGAVPLLLPVISEEEAILEQVRGVDGLLLPGGYDVNPLQYGEEPYRDLDAIFPEVDEHQLTIARSAATMKKPMLGICRGLQLMNVAFGGTLYQDLSQIKGSYIKHVQKAQRHTASHTIDIEAGTELHRTLKITSLPVNSFHHQAVKDLAPGFVVNARSRDGVIEGIEKSGGSFTVAVQWHPEMMVERSGEMCNLFRGFVDAAEKVKT
jgi:putative glutamine amidotransferase